MSLNFKELGKTGEAFVANYLQKEGYTIIAQNYQTRSGEIDVIAMKDDVIAFVEVKLRTKHYFHLSNVIVPSKQRKIIKTAKWFIVKHDCGPKSYRFDVALLEQNKTRYEMTYIPNAFTESESYY